MATTIVTKNSVALATAPSPGQLVQGELAVNVTDKKLYSLDGGGNVVLLSSGSSYDVPVSVTANSATTALIVSQAGAGGGVRITNTGAGNSLLVEDSASTDSTPFVIDASGNVGIGTSTAAVKLDVQDTAVIARITSTTGTNAVRYQVVNTGGTSQFGRESSVGGIILSGADAYATVLTSAGAYPVIFGVNSTERMRITSAGAVAFNGASNYGASGQALISAGNAPPVYTTQFVTAGYVIDGGGAPITSGIKGDITIPFGCTIIEWTLLADVAGSIVVDIWKDTYANYPPTVLDTITGSALPTITAATNGQSSTLTGWTATITAGDTLRFNVNAPGATTITRVTLSLKLART